MKYKFLRLIILIANLFGQGNIEGKITRTDSGVPLLDVNILVQGTFTGTVTNSEGQYNIGSLKPGEYTLVISMIGFKKHTEKNIIVENGTVELDIQLNEDVLSVPHVVVTASRNVQDVMELPVSMSVIGPRKIQDHAAVNIVEVMKFEPGISTVRGQLNIRGTSGFTFGAGDRTLLMIDGVPLLGSGAGNITWTMVPVSEVEQVEIIRSGGSALYGSSALGGVVNILTKNAPLKAETRFRLKSGVYTEPKYKQWQWRSQPGLFNYLDVTHSRPIGKHSTWIRFHKAKSDGYKRHGWTDSNNITGKIKFNFSERYNASFFANYYFDKSALASQWKNADNPFEAPTGEEKDYIEGEKLNLNGFFNIILSQNTVAKFKGSLYKVDWKNHSVSNNDFVDEQKFYSEVQIATTLGQSTQLTTGIVAQKSEIKARIYGDHSSLSMSAYIQAQQRFGKSITLNTGARMETYSVDNKKLDESLAPQVALNFRLFDWLSLRGSVSKGFRVPTVAEMYTKTQLNIFQVMPNPDLKSESSWSREIGLTAQLPGNQWASDLKFDLATFSSTFKRLIEVSLNETGIVQFHNLTDAIISGIELGLSGAMLNRSILFSTAYTQLNPREIDNNRKTLDTLAYRFRHTLVSSLGTRFFGLTAMVENRYMSRMEKVVLFQENPISGEDKRVPIHIWNASLGYEYRDWNFLFRIENMFQYYYTELERNMGDERHFSLMLSKKI